MISENKKVWDFFIRIFHWTLVVAFIVGYLTEGEVYLHFYVGWYISILILLRFIWGFIGTPYARFSDFIKPPSEIIEYATSLNKNDGSKKQYIGHNPLGGLMIIGLLISLSITSASGVLLYTEDGKAALSFIGHSPTASFEDEDEKHEKHEKKWVNNIASNDKYIKHEEHEEEEEEEHEEHEDGDEVLKEIHEFFANFTLLLILLHVAGVVISSRLQKENLVLSMITGKKKINKE